MANMVECKQSVSQNCDIPGIHEYVAVNFSNPLALEKVYFKKNLMVKNINKIIHLLSHLQA